MEACFQHNHIFHHSTDDDYSWILVNNIENDMKVKRTDDDPFYFDHYDAEALRVILDTQHKYTEYTNKIFGKKIFQNINYWNDISEV